LIFIQKWVLKKVLSLHKINLKEYDFVVSNVLFPSGILGNWLKHMYQLKHIHIEHWSGARRFLSRNILRKKGVLALKETNQLVVVSELLEKELIAILQFKKIVVIPNVIGSQFKYLDKMQSSETFRFIAVANWRKPKNPFLFIKALQEIKKEDPNLNFELTLVGEGPQLQIIRKMDLNFPINYTGAVQNKSLANLFQSSNIFLHGSDFETFSIVSIEALMCGLPVIASKVGVLPSVINARNGILCDDTIDSWKEGIRKVLSTPYKNNEIAAQASANFSQRHIKDKFYDLFYNE
jgi:glycosyltransferase involved in cell wall biosynthesis